MVRLMSMFIVLGLAGLLSAAPPTPREPFLAAAPSDKSAAAAVKGLLLEEANQLEKQIAARMIKRQETTGGRRQRLEMEIDLRIIQRAVVMQAANAKFASDEQAIGWHRARQLRNAISSIESGESPAPNPAQLEAMTRLRKLSFTDLKGEKPDDLFANVASAMANAINATPVDLSKYPPMRPTPIAGEAGEDAPATVAALSNEVQKLAAVSVALRQQLLNLSAMAADTSDSKEAASLNSMLSQALALARGLQSNMAVSAEGRTAIETQLVEGIVLYADPRTRQAGQARVEALGAYRQTLGRIGKMGLTKEQLDQFGPALTWAQQNPESGGKLLGTIEQYLALTAKWDAMPATTVPAFLKRATDDARAQFLKARSAFMAEIGRMNNGPGPALDEAIEELKRLFGLVDDLQTMQATMDTINTYKVRPVGGLEKKVTTAALAAAQPAASPIRADGQKYLSSVRTLAKLSTALTAKPAVEIPPTVAKDWGGGRPDAFELRWRGYMIDLITAQIAGSLELDKAKVAKLDQALALGEGLRSAAQFEAATSKAAPDLMRWADWSVDPASLQTVIAPYKEAMAAAFIGYASENADAVDKWAKLRSRYQPLISLVQRDAAYGDACAKMSTGLTGELLRLYTPFDGAPFASERLAAYGIGAWAALERNNDFEAADRLAITLAKRLAGKAEVDDSLIRVTKKLK